jgi:hypothetical protein
MEIQKIVEVLLYFVPAIIVLFASYMLISKFLENQNKVRLLEIRASRQKDMVLLRLQAYERISLYLERIAPFNLIPKLLQNAMSARELHREIIQTVRSEFDHNVTQQIYVSPQAWNAIKNTKEDMLRLVNLSFAKCGEKGSGGDLSKIIFDTLIQEDNLVTQKALDFIKSEAREFF